MADMMNEVDDIFMEEGASNSEYEKGEEYYVGKLKEVLAALESGDVESAKMIIQECLAKNGEEEMTEGEMPMPMEGNEEDAIFA